MNIIKVFLKNLELVPQNPHAARLQAIGAWLRVEWPNGCTRLDPSRSDISATFSAAVDEPKDYSPLRSGTMWNTVVGKGEELCRLYLVEHQLKRYLCPDLKRRCIRIHDFLVVKFAGNPNGWFPRGFHWSDLPEGEEVDLLGMLGDKLSAEIGTVESVKFNSEGGWTEKIIPPPAQEKVRGG